MHLGAAGMLGLTLPEWIAAQELRRNVSAATAAGGKSDASFGRAKACILLFMWGGPAHQDTWDMKPDAPAEVRGEFAPISTKVPGTQI